MACAGSSCCTDYGLHVEPNNAAKADAWDDTVLCPKAHRPFMDGEVLGDDFRSNELVCGCKRGGLRFFRILLCGIHKAKACRFFSLENRASVKTPLG